MSLLSAPFTFLRQIKKVSSPSKTRLLLGWTAIPEVRNSKMPWLCLSLKNDSSFHLPYCLKRWEAAVLFPHQENKKNTVTDCISVHSPALRSPTSHFQSKSSQKGFNLEPHLERVTTLVSPCKASCTIARNYVWCNSSRILFLFCKAR